MGNPAKKIKQKKKSTTPKQNTTKSAPQPGEVGLREFNLEPEVARNLCIMQAGVFIAAFNRAFRFDKDASENNFGGILASAFYQALAATYFLLSKEELVEDDEARQELAISFVRSANERYGLAQGTDEAVMNAVSDLATGWIDQIDGEILPAIYLISISTLQMTLEYANTLSEQTTLPLDRNLLHSYSYQGNSLLFTIEVLRNRLGYNIVTMTKRAQKLGL